MARLGRRRFLAHGTLAAAGATLPLAALWSRRARAGSWGELVPDPAGVLDLPKAFSYEILESFGQAMDDGYVVPGRPDAMACFAGTDGTVVLMRNHEVSLSDASNGAYGLGEAPPEAYDELGFGGVTRVVLDATDFTRISSNLVLAGTARNCAGGPSPWGWLSCEETVDPRHGYVFACSPSASSVAPPRRIDGYGRFRHEAAAVDPETHCCYLTEDRTAGCLYRFEPHDPSEPFEGTLQAMRVVGQPQVNTSVGLRVGDVLEIEWVDLTNPTPSDDTLRVEAGALGAALVSRGEGLWYFEGAVYLCATSGGPAGLGQVFRLIDDPSGRSLELIAQSSDAAVFDFPDNITVSPWGQIFIAEDGGPAQFIRMLTDDGEVVPFARNALSSSEMAGVCFSPDGRAMFLNIQQQGVTLVITGPFSDACGTDTGEGPGSGGEADSGGAADDTGSLDTGPVTTTAAAGADEGSRAPGGLDDDGGLVGCGCSSPGSPARGAAALVGAVALGLRSRAPGKAASED